MCGHVKIRVDITPGMQAGSPVHLRLTGTFRPHQILQWEYRDGLTLPIQAENEAKAHACNLLRVAIRKFRGVRSAHICELALCGLGEMNFDSPIRALPS